MPDRFRPRAGFRYSRWDGTQRGDEPEAQSILDALSDDYLRHGDVRRALQRLTLQGYTDRSGQRRLGMQDLLSRLRQARQRELERHDMSGVMDDLRRRLERVKELEREGIQRRLEGKPAARPEGHGGERRPGDRREAGEPSGNGSPAKAPPGPSGQEAPREPADLARHKLQFLDRLPPDPAGQIRQLSEYEFLDDRAHREFQALLALLQRMAMQPYAQGMQQAISGMTPEELARLRAMVRELNQMLQEKADGGEPDFERFRERYGDAFPGVSSLDELVEHLQRQRMAMQALLDSMTPEQRRQLREVMDALLRDDRLRVDLAELAMNLEQLAPQQTQPRRRLTGDQPLGMAEALRLLDTLREMDALEREMVEARRARDLSRLDPEKLFDLVGEEEAQALQALQSLMARLEAEGLVRRQGERYELTARAIRRIGQKALDDIFARLQKDAFGQHRLPERGHGGERADETKVYAHGDPFHLHLERTLMNGVSRHGTGSPIRLDPDDFEVYRTEHLTQSATVVMLDMSLSMLNNDLWQPAKKVAIALESLIRGQFPRDRLSVVGFSHVGQVYTPEELIELTEWDTLRGTNMVHGLRLARQLLERSRAANKQIIMVTDGGPTVWQEGEHWLFEWPTNAPTELQTLREVRRCARDGIAINVFMLADDPDLKRFVNRMATINQGRAFYTTPDHLGEYVLIDYLGHKQKRVS